MIFVFDLDDTVVDTDGYSEKYILNFFKQNNLPYKQIATNTRFAERKFDWDMETALKWYKTYGDDMMLEFPCKPGAAEVIKLLYDLGHTIIIATARATDWHVNPEQITKQWLKNNNIPYHKLYVGRVDKELICADENADVFVDDDIKITSRVAEHKDNVNMKVFLSTSKYNKELESSSKVIRINDFQEMLDIVFDNNFDCDR